MGTLASCSDPTILTAAECIEPGRRRLLPAAAEAATAAAAEAVTAAVTAAAVDGRQLRGGGGSSVAEGGTLLWTNPPIGSFDDFGSAMRLLYVMSSGDEWEAPMYMMMAATSPGQAPVRNDYSLATLFSIGWMFIGSFFALNLFVGVICDSFDKIKRQSSTSATMTTEQQQWVDTMRAAAKQKPARGVRPPSDCARRVLFDLVTSSTFDGLVMSVIVANVALMACDYWGMDRQPRVLDAFNGALRTFGHIYYAEAVLKLLALGPGGYFRDGWWANSRDLTCSPLISPDCPWPGALGASYFRDGWWAAASNDITAVC